MSLEWPPAFGSVDLIFLQREGIGLAIPEPVDLQRAFHSLGPRLEVGAQPPLHSLVEDWESVSWLRLTEVAADTPRAVLTAKLTAALERVHTSLRSQVLINLGGDGSGWVGLAVGLPRQLDVADSWSNGLATEMIFAPGAPFGWAGAGSGPEAAVVGTVVPTALGDRARTGDGLPTAIELILGAAGSLPPWSIDLVLKPLSSESAEALRQHAATFSIQAAQAASRTVSRTDFDSSTFTDVRAERVREALDEWLSLADDCLAVRGWTVSVRIRAAREADVAALTASFGVALGDQVHVTHPTRRQSWSMAPVHPTSVASPTWLSSRDVADLLLFSGSSVGGIQSRRPLASGRQMRNDRMPIQLGNWLGSTVPAQLDLADLSAHAFIAGITGSGKSTTTRTLLAQISNRYRKPFLVIDPAKTDYQDFGSHLADDLLIVNGRDLKMNVLLPWPGRDVGQHIARVSNAFRGSFSLPSPVPYVVSILFEELAAEARRGEVSLHDAMARLDSLVEELRYRGEIEDNIKASLGLRLRLLLQPGRADRVACPGAVPDWLTERSTVIQLGDIADDEERNFLASMIVLYVADAARARGLVSEVSHILVVEEAHRLMPEPREVGVDEGDAGSVSAKLMAQLLAEIRAYGESLLVIDQSPAAVSREVLRNTNVKLVHRTVDRDDQQALGGSLGLDPADSAMLGSLGVGRVLVSTRHLVQPQSATVDFVLPRFDHEKAPERPPLVRSLCHNAERSDAHHVSQRHGQEMELEVGLWSLGAVADLRERAKSLVRRDPAANAPCLIQVGLRRYLETLVRIGYLRQADISGVKAAWWSAAVAGQAAPQAPRSADRPMTGCVRCLDNTCRVRGVVASRALHAYRTGQADLVRRHELLDMLASITNTTDSIAAQLGTGSVANCISVCAAVHLADQAKVSEALVRTWKGLSSPESG